MSTFFLTLCIAFVAMLGIGLLVNWSRRRAARTRHGLSGMCQRTGGTMCTSCQGELGGREHCGSDDAS